jgi:hypothetical protein
MKPTILGDGEGDASRGGLWFADFRLPVTQC